MQTLRRFRFLLFFFVAGLGYAQPSGGPYGPIDQRYELPNAGPNAGKVYFVAPDGKSDAAGVELAQPTTIEAAMERVVTGDAIVLRGGIYRTGGLVLNQGITIQPYEDEHPVLKGTWIATEWEALPNNVWRTPWSHLFPAEPLPWWNRSREGMKTPLHRFNNDMVFVDGELLLSKGWEGDLDPHSYCIDYKNGYVYIGADPTHRQVEITAYDSALVRTSAPAHGKVSDGKGPVIRGITFTQYAYRALEIEGKKHFTSAEEPTNEPVGISDPATYGKEVRNTLIENVTITYCSRVAGYFRGDGLIIRNSLVSDTGTEGIYIIGSSDVLLERNIIRRNNIKQLTGYFPSAVKIFNQTHRVTFRDNLIQEQPYSNGVWYDVGNRDAVIVDNWVEDAIDGIFIEISRGATIAGNVVVNSHHGLRTLNSADVHAYNNTFFNARVSFERNDRVAAGDTFDWHATTGPGLDQREGHIFLHNLIASTDSLHDPLLEFLQRPSSLCGKLKNAQATEVDGNVYIRAASATGSGAPPPLIVYAPSEGENCTSRLASLDDFRKLQPAFEKNGVQIDHSPRSVLKGPDLGHFELQRALPNAPARNFLPSEVRSLLGWSEAQAETPGAYPLR
ncbi:MAG: right-handed parallel beta-helix repeat-containing protein [Terracidiphilus sp.]|jgi:parallel beta-helix repeat protein